MKRKAREIALLLVPVAAVAFVVPSARLVNNWRAARAVPRVEACYLRKPTPGEVRLGADVGYTTRVVVPDTGGPFWAYKIELSNADGAHWVNGTPAWSRVVVASRERDWPNPDFIAPGNADNRNGVTMEITGGFKWKRVAGKNAKVQAKISLYPDDGISRLQVQAMRIFTLKPSDESSL